MQKSGEKTCASLAGTRPQTAPSMPEHESPLENPIDRDKITETPSTLPYAHHVGSAPIRPDDLKGLRSKALSSMEEQTEMQLDQIREQIDLLRQQAAKVVQRRQASLMYIGPRSALNPWWAGSTTLYERSNGETLLSTIDPGAGEDLPFTFLHSVKLLADHTWEVVDADATA